MKDCIRSKNNYFIIVMITFIYSCSAHGPAFQKINHVPFDLSLIYVYRPDTFCMGGRSPDVVIDQHKIVALSNNGYTRVFARIGLHKVIIKGT